MQLSSSGLRRGRAIAATACLAAPNFFTVNPRDKRSGPLVMVIRTLRAAVIAARAQQAFHIDGCMVLPDHMHGLWTLAEGDADFPGRWQAIKIAFSEARAGPLERSSVMIRRRQRGIWQHRYWEHTIRNDRDHAAYRDNFHFNPKSTALCKPPPIGRIVVPKRISIGVYPPDSPGDDAPISSTGGRR